jgi:hypothetical protein
MTRTWSRRSFLRGAGLALALPLLESLAPRRGRAQAATAPRRLFFFDCPNGMHLPNWTPTGSGTSFTLSPILMPLLPYQNDILVVSGLENTAVEGGNIADGHMPSLAGLLTATTPMQSPLTNTISVDQLAAATLRQHTGLPSLVLGDSSAGNNFYDARLSWDASGNPVAKQIEPAAVFSLLFGTVDPTAGAAQLARQKLYRTSVLDWVTADAKRLQAHLGKSDRARLDQYLTSVRDVEQRIQSGSAAACSIGAAPGQPSTPPARMQMLLDLAVLALQCDQTRVISFQHDASGGGDWQYDFIGVSGDHHTLSHGTDAASYAALTKIDTWEVSQLAYLIGKLKAIPEGNGTMLDNTTVFFASEISNGAQHSHDHLPVVLAGRGGGAITTGRHLSLASAQPLANLFLSLLATVGVNVTTFGKSGTTPLPLA